MSKFGVLKTPFGGASYETRKARKVCELLFLNLCVKFNQHRLKLNMYS